MGGFSSITGLETIVNADNASFDGTERSGAMTTNGELWIGSTIAPHVKKGTLTSPDGSLTIGYSSPNVTLAIANPGLDIINGDTGSITGTTVTIYANQAANNSGATVRFDNSGTISTLSLSDNTILANQFLGRDSGNLTVSGGGNCGCGVSSLNDLTSGENNSAYGTQSMLLLQSGSVNVAVGTRSLQSLVSGSSNVGVGYQALSACTGSQNVAVGESALSAYTGNGGIGIGYLACRDVTGTGNIGIGFISLVNCSTGQNNTGVGYQALTNLGTGSTNTALGYNAGSSLTLTDSGNLLLGNTGTAGDNTTTRIGTSQTKCFAAGITGVTVAASAPIGVDTNGQLSSLGFGTAGQLMTSNGAGASPTYQNAPWSASIIATSANPADSTTYYFLQGSTLIFNTISTNGAARFYATRNCTIDKCYGNIRVAGTLGSNESVTLFLRKNDTTSTDISTTLDFSTANVTFGVTGLAISMAAGDFLTLGMTTPAWGTNPTTVSLSATFST